ncbi:hypothetical protein Tco_0052164 [Tanacetum coccineum]
MVAVWGGRSWAMRNRLSRCYVRFSGGFTSVQSSSWWRNTGVGVHGIKSRDSTEQESTKHSSHKVSPYAVPDETEEIEKLKKP